MNAKPTYGLIGRGRVASHMARYLELENQSVVTWHRGNGVRADDSMAACDVVLLAISDDAIEGFVDAYPELVNRPCVHFSAGLFLDGVHALHPLMTFGPELYDLETYRGIPFIEDPEGLGFRDVFPALSNRAWPLQGNKRQLYHALCVLAGNFSALLWCKAFDDFEDRLGLPRDVLEPFMAMTWKNTVRTGRSAVTGPLVRGDRKTVARNLAALEGDPYVEVYRAFASVFKLEEVTG